jgi:hypothetical protein
MGCGMSAPGGTAAATGPHGDAIRIADEQNARGQAFLMARGRAGRWHFSEHTGLDMPSSAALGLTHSLAGGEWYVAARHLGAARYDEADEALGRAIDAENRGRNKRGAERLEAFRDRVRKAVASAAPVPPSLSRMGPPNPDGSLAAVDHEGRHYEIALGEKVAVTHDGRTLSAPAGDDPARTARELAGRLCGECGQACTG